MNEHPIQGLMKTAMESIKEMIDVNTVVGDAVETQDGSVIIPLSRVAFGFAAGGGDFEGAPKPEKSDGGMPFAGGSGAGVSVQPVGFLVVGQGQIKMLPVDNKVFYDRLLDLAPQVLQQVQGMISTQGQKKPVQEETKITQ